MIRRKKPISSGGVEKRKPTDVAESPAAGPVARTGERSNPPVPSGSKEKVLPTREPPASEQAVVPSPLNGTIAPIEHRFKPGQSGNPGGRPKILTESLAKELAKKVKIKDEETGAEIEVTRADTVAMALVDKASTTMKESVAAYNAIRSTIDPTEEQKGGSTGAITGDNLIRMLEIFERMIPKEAKVIDV